MSSPVVQTKDGAVRGQQRTSVRGGSYWSFQGIPYAKAPVGELRFKPPVPLEPWSGVRDALAEGAPAPAKHMVTQQYLDESSEDCLFINVYTPQLPQAGSTELKPVLFWVHGGGFYTGSGDSDVYGPDYLITEDVLLVTFNYRLGVLGFLGLENAECPGNLGLKDQVAALQWVQRNISAFGGDPKNVTIFGESAGGASVQYLLISKLTKGLFHKAISMSGATFNPWAFNRKPKKTAFVLGELLGCKTDDEHELFNFLKTVPAKDLVQKTEETVKRMKEGSFLDLVFVPVVEPDVPGAFLTKDPAEILRSGDYHDVPYILGVTTLEGLIMIKPGEAIKQFNTDEELQQLIPPDLEVEPQSELQRDIVNKIRAFYFPKGFTEKSLIQLLSSTFFINGINKTVCLTQKNPKRKSNTYLYQFSFDGEKRFIKDLLGFKHWKGTCHADELGYLFHINFLQPQLTPGTPEYGTVETMTKLWTDFAKHGNPTPNNLWLPVTQSSAPYLDIDTALTIRQDLDKDAADLWGELYKSACTRTKGKL